MKHKYVPKLEDCLPGYTSPEDKKWVHQRLEDLGYNLYISTFNRPFDTYDDKNFYGFEIDPNSDELMWMRMSRYKENVVPKEISWWKEQLGEPESDKIPVIKKKTYWLNKDRNSPASIELVHKLMEDAHVTMGSSHGSRINDSFDYHFEYNVSNNAYLARTWLPDSSDTQNVQRSAEWFMDYIKNGFVEHKFIDNSESSKNTILDKQTKLLNTNDYEKRL